jgi:hypothetical protein
VLNSVANETVRACAAIPVSGKFNVLHGFNGVLAVFFHFGRIFTPL